MLEVAVAALVGYLLGTFPSADVVSRIATRGRVDLRATGSGNPGGLNAMKQIGTAWGVVVIVADIVKGVVAGFAGMAIGGDGGGYAAATTSMAGHIFPVWSRFKGGKGVATSAGACLAVFPAFFPIDAAVAMFGAARTRHPERTIWGNAVVWIASALVWWLVGLPNLWGPDPAWGLVAFSATGAGMIVWKFAAAARVTRSDLAA
ncbi:MAG TPA: glycerol-3-phosphate acyltransferase [Acidimicrobiia bacterium]|nr:glycerol-3-phosphate acyltransferase [Acidimicrobiia bacterium]